jgi:type IV pilus assembly protein PilM
MGTNGKTARPPVACEITGERVLAARATAGAQALEAAAARPLPMGALAPGFSGANVQDSAALESAIRGALADAGARGNDLALVLPDAAVRVMLLDFDTLPQKQGDASPLVRFRLKKLLPFDSDRAAVSYQVQRGPAGSPVHVIAAVADQDVLAEYESAVRAAGFTPGIVLPSILAMLGAVDSSAPTLVLKAESGTTAVAIVDQDEIRVLRTLETLTPASAAPQRLAEDIYPSLVYFQDTYGAQVSRMVLGGTGASNELRAALEQQTGLKAMELTGAGSIPSPRTAFAGVYGALVTT